MSNISSPESLVAIIVAARRAGDRELERKARAALKAEFKVELRFREPAMEDAQNG